MSFLRRSSASTTPNRQMAILYYEAVAAAYFQEIARGNKDAA